MSVIQYSYDMMLGPITIEAEGENIIGLYLPGDGLPGCEIRETPTIKNAALQLEEYFAGTRKTFNLKLDPKGTEFQKRVWETLCRIPYGETISYKELGVMAGCPDGARAVGMAMRNNPIPLIMPCHRIISSSGKIGGFSSGIATKEKLLRLEGSL